MADAGEWRAHVTAEWLPRVRAGYVHARVFQQNDINDINRSSLKYADNGTQKDNREGSADFSVAVAVDAQSQRLRVRCSGTEDVDRMSNGDGDGDTNFKNAGASRNESYWGAVDVRESGLDLTRFQPLLDEKHSSDGASVRLTPAGKLTDLPGSVKYDAFLFSPQKASEAAWRLASAGCALPARLPPVQADAWAGAQLACRKCVEQHARENTESVSTDDGDNIGVVLDLSTAPIAVKSLPSDSWLDIADSWLCGCACSDGITEFAHLALREIVPRQNEMLVGENHLLVAREHLSEGSIEVCFDQRFKPITSPVPAEGASGLGNTFHAAHIHNHTEDTSVGSQDTLPHSDIVTPNRRRRQWLAPLRCRRCRAVLGTLPLEVSDAPSSGMLVEEDIPRRTTSLAELPSKLTAAGCRLYYFALGTSQSTPSQQALGWLQTAFTIERAVAGLLLSSLRVHQAPVVVVRPFCCDGEVQQCVKLRLLSKDVYSFQCSTPLLRATDIHDPPPVPAAFERSTKVAFTVVNSADAANIAALGGPTDVEVVWMPLLAVLELARVLELSNAAIPKSVACIPVVGIGRRANIAYLRVQPGR